MFKITFGCPDGDFKINEYFFLTTITIERRYPTNMHTDVY